MDTEAVHDLRRRVLAGETPSKEELRAAIEHLQPARLGDISRAAESSKEAASARSQKSAISLDEFL